MDIYEVVVDDVSNVTFVLNYIEEMKNMLGLERSLKPESIRDNIIYYKLTPMFANSVSNHRSVVSTRIAL